MSELSNQFKKVLSNCLTHGLGYAEFGDFNKLLTLLNGGPLSAANEPRFSDSMDTLLRKATAVLNATEGIGFPIPPDYSYTANDGSTYADLLSKIGATAFFNGATGLSGITTLTFNKLVKNRETIDIENSPNLLTLNFPVLQQFIDGCYVQISDMPLLTQLLMPVLVSFTNEIDVRFNSVLATLSWPALTLAHRLHCDNNPALALVSLPVLTTFVGPTLKFNACNLTAASVNHILARMVVCGVGSGKTISLDGGTNAAPTGQGITDKAALIAAGATVTTN